MMSVLEKVVEVEEVSSLSELEAELDFEFKRAKDMQSFAFHVQGKEGKALCGTSAIFYGTKTVTVEGIMVSLPHQNAGWFWCEKCAAAFTGKPAQLFLEMRTPSRH